MVPASHECSFRAAASISVAGDALPVSSLLRCTGGVVCVWIHGTDSLTTREMESSIIYSSFALITGLLHWPWVPSMKTNFLDSVTRTYITQESPQHPRVTSTWHSFMFISLGGPDNRNTGSKKNDTQQRWFGAAAAERDPWPRLEEQFTWDIISYNHALMPYMQPPHCLCAAEARFRFLFPIQSLFISLICTA